jgi:hypothetical protein
MSTTKFCGRCRSDLPATKEFFHRNKRHHDGLQYWCKTCTRDHMREYQRQHAEANQQRSAQWYQEHIEQAKDTNRKYNLKAYWEMKADPVRWAAYKQEHYEAKHARYLKLKADPVKYRAHLDHKNEYNKQFLKELKKDPVKYAEYRRKANEYDKQRLAKLHDGNWKPKKVGRPRKDVSVGFDKTQVHAEMKAKEKGHGHDSRDRGCHQAQ